MARRRLIVVETILAHRAVCHTDQPIATVSENVVARGTLQAGVISSIILEVRPVKRFNRDWGRDRS